MEIKDGVGSIDANEFIRRIETLLEVIMERYFNLRTVVFLNKPVMRPASSESPGLISNKEFCNVFGISRTTLANWEKNSKTKALIMPFIVQNGHRKAYDSFGFTVIALENPDKFKNIVVPEYWKRLSDEEIEALNRTDKIFSALRLRIESNKIVSPAEYRYYMQECHRRRISPKKWISR